MSARFPLASLVWLALASAPVAQTLARFEPARVEANALELAFVRERGGRIERQAWPASDAGWLFVRQEGTQRNLDAFVPRAEDPRLLRVELDGAGPALVGWDLAPRVERTSAGELRRFLDERAGGRALPRALEGLAAEERVAVRRLESLALLVRDGEPGPSAVAIGKTGQRMELRALLDPGAVAPGGDFVFKLYQPEGRAEGVLCRAVELASRMEELLELQADGSLRVKLARPGTWMIEAQRLRALDGSQDARFELASATLVFLVAGDGK